jgi:hypothetical protein
MAYAKDPLALQYDFSRLSLSDLLQARDTYHYHLLNKANVVGTAVGLYLIRHDEAWPQKKGEGKSPLHKKTYARTFANSEVRDYSWPCILALVRDWATEADFGAGAQYDPSQFVPKTLYLADGRAVPVCVVQVDQVGDAAARDLPPPRVAPGFPLGGGLPINVQVQGVEYQATAGCLVSDGHLTYALTARHVCGETGTAVSSRLRSGPVSVGLSSDKQLTRKLFSEVYPDFPGRRTYVTLDVGLIRIDAVDAWTSNTYSLPALGPLADIHEHNLTLRLIDKPVLGYGAVSGLLRGTIKALFYRHQSVGGYDYVSDFLIDPGKGPGTRHGDSGMIWHLDVTEDDPKAPKALCARDLRPLALEWGGQVFANEGSRSAFAVATSLSNVCKLLDVELVTDQSRGVSGYWGRTGHYSIAAFAIQLIKNPGLKAFMKANADVLSFDLQTIEGKTFDKDVGQLSIADKFVPLADVPDEIWKKLPTGKKAVEGGRDVSAGKTGSDGPEHPNHYADIDAPDGPHGETWRAQCLADDANLTPAAWQAFYARMATNADKDGNKAAAQQYRTAFKQGILPFRVWQFFDAMVGFLKAKDVVGFLTAAGTVAHYVGDGSQPLHGSIYADGDPSRTAERDHPLLGTTETVMYGKGVHSAYETAMVSYKAAELIPLIQGKLPANGHGLALCTTGTAAARALVELMDKSAATLPPIDLVEAFEKAGADTTHATLDALWNDFHEPTAEVMVLGARYLAMLWDSAWTEGDGAKIAASKLKQIDPDDARSRYIDKDFVPSLTLKQIGAVLT